MWLAALSACAPKASSLTVDRIVFLDIDNLTGEDSLDWMARAIPVMAGQQLSGLGKILPKGPGNQEEKK